jgi:hypothetical protein
MDPVFQARAAATAPWAGRSYAVGPSDSVFSSLRPAWGGPSSSPRRGTTLSTTRFGALATAPGAGTLVSRPEVVPGASAQINSPMLDSIRRLIGIYQ